MNTLPLPAAIQAEKRSNLPFLLRFSIMLVGIALILAGSIALGIVALGGGFLSLGFWAYDMAQKNEALLGSLTQAELVSMIGREGETWRSTDSIVRELDKRFPAWRERG